MKSWYASLDLKETGLEVDLDLKRSWTPLWQGDWLGKFQLYHTLASYLIEPHYFECLHGIYFKQHMAYSNFFFFFFFL